MCGYALNSFRWIDRSNGLENVGEDESYGGQLVVNSSLGTLNGKTTSAHLGWPKNRFLLAGKIMCLQIHYYQVNWSNKFVLMEIDHGRSLYENGLESNVANLDRKQLNRSQRQTV